MEPPGMKAAPTLKVTDWYVLEQGCDQVARRREVWGLLGWYHRTQVEPYLGLRGLFRRLWNRLRGKAYLNLSVWDRISLTNAIMQREAEARLNQEEQAARAAQAPTDPA